MPSIYRQTSRTDEKLFYVSPSSTDVHNKRNLFYLLALLSIASQDIVISFNRLACLQAVFLYISVLADDNVMSINHFFGTFKDKNECILSDHMSRSTMMMNNITPKRA